jgi:hypothetical protein
MSDQVIDAVTAQALYADAYRDHALAGWVVMRDPPEPGFFVARLVTDAPTPYVLRSDTLAGLHAQLPPGLVRSKRQPSEPPDLVEIWFAGERTPCLSEIQNPDPELAPYLRLLPSY